MNERFSIKISVMSQNMSSDLKFPRVAITYCTQCRWMLRAAYYAQELLSTFSTVIGEVALIPATGGIFTISLTYQTRVQERDENELEVKSVLLWDRKTEGFPETKVLKQRVRDHLEPERDLGHSDTLSKDVAKSESKILKSVAANDDGIQEAGKCVDCA